MRHGNAPLTHGSPTRSCIGTSARTVGAFVQRAHDFFATRQITPKGLISDG
jgi:hypothetical protein